MVVIEGTSIGGEAGKNEDFWVTDGSSVVLLDGVTARIETGCFHGTEWYVDKLGKAILNELPASALDQALKRAIEQVANLHRDTCDLKNEATPAAAVAIVQSQNDRLKWLILGDVSIVIAHRNQIRRETDRRGRESTPPAQLEADKYLIGDPRKFSALKSMKKDEVKNRNTDAGFKVASSNPADADAAITGVEEAQNRSIILASDGALRPIDEFQVWDWSELFERVNEDMTKVLISIREIEDSDPNGKLWPRNKKSDDATLVLMRFT